MLKYIIKRLAQSVLILLGVSLIIYVLIRCMPVDFVTQKLSSITTTGAETSQELIDAMLKQYGLDTNIFEGYIAWLGKLLKLDFGNSFKYGIPVIDVIKDHMGVSFAVAAIATIFEFLIAIPLGVTAATHQYSVRDYIVTVLVMIGISLPSFFFGQLLKNIFAIQLEWFPASGLIDASKDLSGFALLMDQMWHLFIPILTVVILSIGGRMRMTRTNMLEVLNSDYIRTARAKGLKEKVVIYKHAFRNTMIPLVTSLAGLLLIGVGFGPVFVCELVRIVLLRLVVEIRENAATAAKRPVVACFEVRDALFHHSHDFSLRSGWFRLGFWLRVGRGIGGIVDGVIVRRVVRCGLVVTC